MSKKEKLLASAQKSLQKGQVSRAIKDYQQLVQVDAGDVRIRQKLAELLGRDKRIEEALDEYEAVAKHYTKTGFYLKAIAVYKQMQKLDPSKAEIYLHLAELNEKQGLVGNALAEYRNLVAYYEKHQMLSEAINVLQKMRELEPENLNILVRIAETYAKNGLKDKAWEEFEEALTILRKKEDLARVVKLYEIFLPLYPDVAEMKTGLAQALIQKGEAEKGMEILKNLLQETSEQPDILKILARGYREARDYVNERLTYQHLLRHASGDLDLRQGYIQACLDSGEGTRALEELKEWKESFLGAERVCVLQGFYENLSQVFPDDEHIRTSLQSIYEIHGGKPTPQQDISAGVVVPEIPSAKDSPDLEVEGEAGFLPHEDGEVPEDASALLGEEEKEPVVPTGMDDDFEDLEEIPLEFLEGVGEFEPEETVTDQVAPQEIAEAEETAPEEVLPEQEIEKQEIVTEELEPDLELELELELELDSEEAIDNGEFSLDEEGGILELEVNEALSLDDPLEEEPSAPESAVELEEEILELEPGDAFPAEETEEAIGLPSVESAAEPEEEILDLGMDEALPPEEQSVVQGVDLRAELEEAEFYLQQGLLDDAERICQGLLEGNPGCGDILDKLEAIEARRRLALPAEQAPEPEQLFDLAGEISEEVLSEFDEGFVAFADSQMGIETSIDVEDTESHYNLGIAYKEMGLLDEAVSEFDKAMNNAARRVDCLTLKGICLSEKGAFEQGEEAFKNGLAHPGLSDGERTSLLYEMGLLYEGWGRHLEALDSFQSVADADLFFRDVGEKVQALRMKLGLDDSEDDGESGPKGDKNRVSYV